ncbi:MULTISPECIES: hypothetical protein [unclassified Mesorhizobium]|uniref:hypothetical protein n=1 Tax=unclassified Mesorhizobium TaxID=325217 RepID=UPI000F74F401|nr:MULTISPECIES: hypothetical protein [unclassified Mesorhizobium]TGT56888.1 hypothetical protein EN813_041535 [Mesorhizobium sp. M00.F.Ca.ET.170.01.1.1]AZO08657.1 hypothetical protein EJ074_05630 [Mesorhizobium sp. M3A.F.Ca.ET.080.04.2.1]RWB71774.1 MAG: hypothetical protein EOQ49_14845 [Mesorhizobium sp.]RWB84974.1 MAG: hypothetical protein EOQ52_22060 [Mesorhizobium sp.]RWE21641.1 MAG: hypothetical protein EOS41_26335 [Mesorhizobium sp.]
MRRVSIAIACAMLSLPAATQASLAGECRQLLESNVKIDSMRQYAAILASAARNGWNFAPAAIDSGSKRHFEETRLQLIAAGFEVLPVGAHPRCADEVASK